MNADDEIEKLRRENAKLREKLDVARTAMFALDTSAWNDGCGCCGSGQTVADDDDWKAIVEALSTDVPRS